MSQTIHTLQKNTFQCVLATDGNQSYAIFLYNETEWTTQYDPDNPDLNPTPAKVGFNDGTTLRWVFLIFRSNLYCCVAIATPFLSVLMLLFPLDAGYLNKSFEVPCSRTPEIMNISMSSNVGRPGVWIFRIDEDKIIPACLTESKKKLSSCISVYCKVLKNTHHYHAR